MERVRSHYDVLGVDPAVDDQAVRRAWKVLIQVWHPDRFAEGDLREEAERTTVRINEAFQALREPAKRAAYDRQLEADNVAANAARSAPPPPRRPFEHAPFGERASTLRSRSFAAAAPVQPPPTVAESATDFLTDMWNTARRHPRVMMTVAGVWLVILGSGLFMSYGSAPALPDMPASPRVVAGPDPIASIAAADAQAAAADQAAAANAAAPDANAAADAAAGAQPPGPAVPVRPRHVRTVLPQLPPYATPVAPPAPAGARTGAPRGAHVLHIQPQ